MTMTARTLTILLATCAAPAWGAGCSVARPLDSASSAEAADTSDLTISAALSFDDPSPAVGQTVNAQVTYENQGASSVSVQAVAIAARPPGGSHTGGPYDDFLPYAPATTLAPGQSLTVQATRTFTSADPTGGWDIYPTYQDSSGAWHDGPDVTLAVGAPAGFSVSSALTLDSSTVAPGGTVHGAVTYTNGTSATVTVAAGVIAARPPGGTHAGGPYDDFAPYAPMVAVAPGQTYTVQASRTFTASDPAGAWDVYPTYEDGDGVWHDGADATLNVTAPGGAGGDAGTGDAGGGDGNGPPLIAAPLTGDVENGTWQAGTINGMDYQFLLPSGYSTTSAYPLVLYLHQLDNASQIPSQIDPWFNDSDFRTNHPSIVVAPQCNMDADPSGNTINWGGVSPDDQPCQDNAIALVKQFMSAYSVYAPKVYVTGNSMGGIGSWDIIIKYNSKSPTVTPLFAATLILAGATYDHGYPTPDADVVSALAHVPIWAIHGGQDDQVPLDWDRNMYAAQQAQGGLMQLLVDPALAHDVWDTYYVTPTADMYWDWLFAQTF